MKKIIAMAAMLLAVVVFAYTYRLQTLAWLQLPAFAVTASQSRQISRVKAELGDSYDWIDAEKVLDAHKDEAIYYHTDHHWTSLGAWYAFQGAKTQLGLDKSEEIKMKAYAVSDSFNGTLSAKSGYETDYKEPIYIYLPKSADARAGGSPVRSRLPR